jgi:hypothetical protein
VHDARDGVEFMAGATGPGPGKARPEGMSSHTLCAIMIWETWKHVHKVETGPEKPPSGGGRRGLLAINGDVGSAAMLLRMRAQAIRLGDTGPLII